MGIKETQQYVTAFRLYVGGVGGTSFRIQQLNSGDANFKRFLITHRSVIIILNSTKKEKD